MMNCNWMVKAAISNQKALIEQYGMSRAEVVAMDHRETSRELKRRGYTFPKLNNHGCP